MNGRDAIENVISGRHSARIPRALYGAGRWAYRQTGLQIEKIPDDPAGFAASLAALFATLDTDIVFAGSGLNSFPAESVGGTLVFEADQAPLLAGPIIETVDDARYFQAPDIRMSPHTGALVEMIAELRHRLPDRLLCVTSWGPFTWGMILCDWNRLKERTVTDPDFIRAVCDLGVRLTQALCMPLVERGLIDGIAVPDGAATLISVDHYRDIVLPCQKKLFDWARDHGLRSVLHQCGRIDPQLSLYPRAGADIVSVDASVPIRRARELFRDRSVTAGNVDAVNEILPGDPASITRAVQKCLTAVTDPRHRYILMPSCDLPPDTPIENVEAFLAAADRV